MTATSSNKNSIFATTNDVITFQFSTSEPINASLSSITVNNGQSISITGSGTSYTAQYTVQKSDSSLSLSFFLVDFAGNSGTYAQTASGVTICNLISNFDWLLVIGYFYFDLIFFRK